MFNFISVCFVVSEPRRERVVLFVLSESTVLITTVLPMCYALSVLRALAQEIRSFDCETSEGAYLR